MTDNKKKIIKVKVFQVFMSKCDLRDDISLNSQSSHIKGQITFGLRVVEGSLSDYTSGCTESHKKYSLKDCLVSGHSVPQN